MRKESLPSGPKGLIPALVRKIEARPSSISSVLGQYDRIEVAARTSLAWRYELHEALRRAIAKTTDRGLAGIAKRHLRGSARTRFASQILLMKTLASSSFPASREERVEWLLDRARGRVFRHSVWALRVLGSTRWPEAVDGLVALMEGEEAAGRSGGILWQLASAEIYHVLGARASQGTAATIAHRWRQMERKVPQTPRYDPPERENGAGTTVLFFGDRISPRSVFVIDTSSSMRQKATVGRSAAGRTVVGGSEKGRGSVSERKVVIVKKELDRALSGLQDSCQFNVLAYNSTFTPWRPGPPIKLWAAGSSSVRSARGWTRNLKTDTGTNIHDSMEAALQVADVDTVYLLSDGEPSRGGGKGAIEKRVRHLNYLRGIRIVTYGFTPEGKGSFDEKFMQRLASDHWGWYRRLNR